MRMIKHRSTLPRDLVDFLSFEIFKALLAMAQSNLLYLTQQQAGG